MSRLQESLHVVAVADFILAPPAVIAAQGELGTGIPKFGIYSAALGVSAYTAVWQLEDATVPFPSGCTSLILSPATMGVDSYKIVFLSQRALLFAHGP